MKTYRVSFKVIKPAQGDEPRKVRELEVDMDAEAPGDVMPVLAKDYGEDFRGVHRIEEIIPR